MPTLMADFESTKAKFLAALERLITKRGKSSKRGLLDDWTDLLTATGITSLEFSINERELHDDHNDDEIDFNQPFYLYDSDYLRECCAPGDDCLAGKHCIPIGGYNGANNFIYISDNLKLGIADLHREDVFSAEDLDKEVAETAAYLKISLPKFVDFLLPRTDYAQFGLYNDGSKFLLVENLGSKVRYCFNLPEDLDDGEREFDTPAEAEAFFFSLIERGTTTADLSIHFCPPHLEQRIEGLLNRKRRKKRPKA